MKIKVWLVCALLLCLLAACQSGTESTEKEPEAPQETVTLRWGVVDPTGEKTMEALRINQVNALLREKGYAFQVDIEYMTEASADVDIITFPVMGVGAQWMEETLLPLEPYLEEGQPLYKAASLLPEQFWQFDQIEGHNYNFGQLVDAQFIAFLISYMGEETPQEYNWQALRQNGTAQVPDLVQTLEAPIKVAMPYVSAWGDELGLQCAFHMVAPGVGLQIDGGVAFENVWESQWVEEALSREEHWLFSGQGATYTTEAMQRDWPFFIMRGSTRLEEIKQSESGAGVTVPSIYEGNIVPSLERRYTSVLRASDRSQEALELLGALGSDAELANALCEPIQNRYQNRLTEFFPELCTIWLLRERDTQESMQARLQLQEEGRISPILGFSFDASPVAKEMQAVQAVMQEGTPMAVGDAVISAEESGSDMTGVVSTWREEIEQMKAALQEAGIDTIVEEANRQLQAWREE